MADYRIIDADGHVMELDEELREFIGPPTRIWNGTRAIPSGPASPWTAICALSGKKAAGPVAETGPRQIIGWIFWTRTGLSSPSSTPLKVLPTTRFRIKTGRSAWPAPTTIGSTTSLWPSVPG